MAHEVLAHMGEMGDPDDAVLVADWSRQRSEMIAHQAALEIWREVPGYADNADLALFSEVERHAHQVLGVYLTCVRERRHPRRGDFPWTARHAMRRVDLGIGLSDFLRAFRVGQLASWDDVMSGVSDQTIPGGAALSVVEHVLRTIEVGSSVAAETYLEAHQYQLADSARLARDLIDDLLAGDPPTTTEREHVLDQAGLVDGSSFVVAVATLPDIDAQERDLRYHVRRSLSGTNLGLIVSRHDEVIALLPVGAGAEDRVLSEVRSAVTSLAGAGVFARVGASAVHQGHESVPDAYAEARIALHALTSPGMRAMSELSTLDLLVHSQDGLSRMVPPEVRAFIIDDLANGAVLVNTLSAYVKHDLNARETALHLRHHVNTVYYRLDRIAERTGRDIRSASDLIDLLLAVRLIRAEA